jgi:hypothetical protein
LEDLLKKANELLIGELLCVLLKADLYRSISCEQTGFFTWITRETGLTYPQQAKLMGKAQLARIYKDKIDEIRHMNTSAAYFAFKVYQRDRGLANDLVSDIGSLTFDKAKATYEKSVGKNRKRNWSHRIELRISGNEYEEFYDICALAGVAFDDKDDTAVVMRAMRLLAVSLKKTIHKKAKAKKKK